MQCLNFELMVLILVLKFRKSEFLSLQKPINFRNEEISFLYSWKWHVATMNLSRYFRNNSEQLTLVTDSSSAMRYSSKSPAPVRSLESAWSPTTALIKSLAAPDRAPWNRFWKQLWRLWRPRKVTNSGYSFVFMLSAKLIIWKAYR